MYDSQITSYYTTIGIVLLVGGGYALVSRLRRRLRGSISGSYEYGSLEECEPLTSCEKLDKNSKSCQTIDIELYDVTETTSVGTQSSPIDEIEQFECVTTSPIYLGDGVETKNINHQVSKSWGFWPRWK